MLVSFIPMIAFLKAELEDEEEMLHDVPPPQYDDCLVTGCCHFPTGLYNFTKIQSPTS
jgi:hypothetical protein